MEEVFPKMVTSNSGIKWPVFMAAGGLIASNSGSEAPNSRTVFLGVDSWMSLNIRSLKLTLGLVVDVHVPSTCSVSSAGSKCMGNSMHPETSTKSEWSSANGICLLAAGGVTVPEDVSSIERVVEIERPPNSIMPGAIVAWIGALNAVAAGEILSDITDEIDAVVFSVSVRFASMWVGSKSNSALSSTFSSFGDVFQLYCKCCKRLRAVRTDFSEAIFSSTIAATTSVSSASKPRQRGFPPAAAVIDSNALVVKTLEIRPPATSICSFRKINDSLDFRGCRNAWQRIRRAKSAYSCRAS